MEEILPEYDQYLEEYGLSQETFSEIFKVSTDYFLKETEEMHGTAKEVPPHAGEPVREVYQYNGNKKSHYEYHA